MRNGEVHTYKCVNYTSRRHVVLCERNKGVEKTTYREALRSVLLTTYHSDGQIKKREMGGAWETGEVHTEIW
jgi:hypothetical protein